jgi:hypothetical protein
MVRYDRSCTLPSLKRVILFSLCSYFFAFCVLIIGPEKYRDNCKIIVHKQKNKGIVLFAVQRHALTFFIFCIFRSRDGKPGGLDPGYETVPYREPGGSRRRDESLSERDPGFVLCHLIFFWEFIKNYYCTLLL